MTKAPLGDQPKSRSAMAAPWFSIPHNPRLQHHSKTPVAKIFLGTAGKGTMFAISEYEHISCSITHQGKK
jgi:hypothetical protein